ncbi:hypothetical protein BDN67DRAFT_1017858 [Paxillus ammoniavirescens]|nr:hypothetical protein BDN67DRAFT_1017858 [Paxillus ammoniavirescens]
MHLAGNLSDLLISLWRGLISCANTDDVATWPWAVLSDDDIWKAHGEAVHNAGRHISGSFDAKPRNIAEKINTDYKTWEFQLYTFGLGPALLYGILPEPYWINYCKLVITAEEVREAHDLLCSWHHKFEELYYQRREDRLHFVRLSVHQVIHLAPETIQKGPPICYAQWTMEWTIGNLKQEVWQPSNYFMNIAYEGVRCSCINALLAAVPQLNYSRTIPPTTAINIGDGFVLLHKRDKMPVYPPASDGSADAISAFLGAGHPHLKIKRSARLLLPNGQIARSAWREKLRPEDQLRCSRMIKFKLDGCIRFGEALYYTRIAVNEDNRANNAFHFANVALVQLFSPPDNALLQLSHTTVPTCQATQEVRVINIKDIVSVVGMIPHSPRLPSGEVGKHFFMLERPGLDVSHFIQTGQVDDEVDDSDTE